MGEFDFLTSSIKTILLQVASFAASRGRAGIAFYLIQIERQFILHILFSFMVS